MSYSKKCKVIRSKTIDINAPIILGVNFLSISGSLRGTKYHLNIVNDESIIASTDSSLSIPLIPEWFVEYYLTNDGIDDVIVEFDLEEDISKEYIPSMVQPIVMVPKVSFDNTIFISKIKSTWTKEEVEEIIVDYCRALSCKEVYTDKAACLEWLEKNL